ncbi:flavodoxin family protein [Leptolyngbya iicbica]|uniref:Flavodoxin family protein n=2 Tax=Cyanophyceae TaxID=3028117 RepID=A0A4Q7EAV1_9CYAN|nr:flavodoxin family protein [Leptolyngbya sp. LK]RZM79639.1 flavodoxin family protein [Leptolyngbya sp. LK]
MTTTPRIIGIVGSYRKHGTIDTAVSAILAAAEAAGAETHKIYLQDQHIEFCTNCRVCLQQPGPQRGTCVLADDMATILDELETADAFVLGAPVNFGGINALTQRFVERCVCYGYWPWGQKAPTLRQSQMTKQAVLVSSSAAPGWLARRLTHVTKTLRQVAQLLGAKPIGTVWIGMIDPQNAQLSPRLQRQAQKLGQRLAAA